VSEPISRAGILDYEREPKLLHRAKALATQECLSISKNISARELTVSHISASTVICGSPDGTSQSRRYIKVKLVRGIATWQLERVSSTPRISYRAPQAGTSRLQENRGRCARPTRVKANCQASEKARFVFCVTLKAVCSYSAHGRFERTLAPSSKIE
jgi:hypothetical protein